MTENLPAPGDSRILIYQSDSGEISESTTRKFRIVQIEGTRQVRRLVFKEGELTSKATVKKYLTVRGGDSE